MLPFRRATQKFFAFPSLWNNSNHVVNLRDIEQGIDQINRLGSQSAKMTMDAGSKGGHSNINIENTIGRQATISIGADNSGNRSTGKQKRKTSFNYDNFFGINDNIYLNYSESAGVPLFGSGPGFNNEIGTNDNSSNRFSKSFYAATSIPFGYWTFGSSYSYSNYLLTTSGTATTFKSSGNSESKTYYIDRVLSRGQKYKISLKGELGKSDTDSYLEDTYLPVNSRRTTEANFYLNNTFYVANGSLYFQPKYSKGLSAFGAMKDRRDLTSDKPRAQFETFGLYAQSNLNFHLPKTAIPFNHKLTFDSTKSSNSLYGSDQFSLGGRYTIRGFQESIISGDSGYLVKNDLSFRLADIVPKAFLSAKTMNYGGEKFSPSAAFSKMRFGIFHDYGYVRNHVIDNENDEGYMSGAGANISYAGNVMNWDLTYSKGLHSPQFLRNLDHLAKDGETIYFSLSFNLGML
jgi:hemolysin activation/secretion protein